MRVAGDRVAIDEDVWADEVGRFHSTGTARVHGFVFVNRADVRRGEVVLRLIAYGERHPHAGRSVYERAHRRLHGRYPEIHRGA